MQLDRRLETWPTERTEDDPPQVTIHLPRAPVVLSDRAAPQTHCRGRRHPQVHSVRKRLPRCQTHAIPLKLKDARRRGPRGATIQMRRQPRTWNPGIRGGRTPFVRRVGSGVVAEPPLGTDRTRAARGTRKHAARGRPSMSGEAGRRGRAVPCVTNRRFPIDTGFPLRGAVDNRRQSRSQSRCMRGLTPCD